MRKILLPLMMLCLVSCGEKIGPEGGEDEKDIYLDKPTGLAQVDQAENSVKISWNAVANAAEYQYRLTEEVSSPEPSTRILAIGNTPGTYKTIWGLDPYSETKGIKYYVSVAAINGKSTSGFCDPVQVVPAGIPPVKLTFNATADDFLFFKASSKAFLNDGIGDATYEVKSDGAVTTLEVVSEYLPKPDMEYFATIPDVIDGVSLPSNYTFANNIFDSLPMWASSNTTDLHFKSYLGILALTIIKDEAAKLNSLTLTALTDIAGAVTSHQDGEQPSVVVEGTKSIVFGFGAEGLAINASGTTVYFPLPAGDYSVLEVSAVFGEEEPALIQINNIKIVSGEKKSAWASYAKEPDEPSSIGASDMDNDDYFNNVFGNE